jgi:hypothetical protein
LSASNARRSGDVGDFILADLGDGYVLAEKGGIQADKAFTCSSFTMKGASGSSDRWTASLSGCGDDSVQGRRHVNTHELLHHLG